MWTNKRPLIHLAILAWLFACIFNVSLATPVRLTSFHSSTSTLLSSRDVEFNNVTGTLQVFNPANKQLIPQGPASDGGGSGFDAPAILWLVFSFLVGIPLAVAGIRGWRLTIGAGLGLSVSVAAWASFINTVNNTGIPDIVLAAIIFGLFFFGCLLGLFEVGRIAGIFTMGLVGGMAFGIRVVLLKSDLLVPVYFVNWVIVAAFGIAGGSVVIWKQRVGLTIGTASAGTFLVSLGLDLALSKQTGISRGLRFFFDRNSSHIADIIQNGYKPTLLTQIIIGVSLALTPALAYGQHRYFPQPFSRKPVQDWTITSAVWDPGDKGSRMFDPGTQVQV